MESVENQPATGALIHALSCVSEDINGLRKDVADLRSDLRSLREHSQVQDGEIWARDGDSKLGRVTQDLRAQALQIRGLWGVVCTLVGLISGVVLSHFR